MNEIFRYLKFKDSLRIGKNWNLRFIQKSAYTTEFWALGKALNIYKSYLMFYPSMQHVKWKHFMYKFTFNSQKQPLRDVLKESCSENMQQICKRTPMPKRDFNKIALQLYLNHTSAWVFSSKFAAYFQNTFY